ncbi:conserved oligomeric Golgi complex subunit 4 [[Candida] anglica]|uniref:Conserved oligomeric Golgi complex subunit 4 n=1 Tax=[Candida] anglica TaxID=148631 RepID=A0ABP0EJ64_9ASCO
MSGIGDGYRPTLVFPTLSESDLDQQCMKIIDNFGTATSLDDLNAVLQEINVTTGAIDKSLNHKTIVESRRFQHELSGIELNRAKLSNATVNSDQLSQLLSSANDLGNTLTYKIKTLDSEIQKVKETLDFVTNIQTLKNNINQANYALEHKNWTLAAQCIHNVHSKEFEEIINGKFASVVIPSTDIPELPHVTLGQWKEQLSKEFERCFNEAANQRNVPEITKYFQLFPLIDREEVGLTCYSKFICSIVADTSRSLVGSISRSGNESQTGIYSSVSSQLFESISMMLSQHGPMIKKYYGSTYPNALVYVLGKIQTEIDSQIGLIGDTFYDMRRIDKVLQDIQLYQFPILTRRLQEFKTDSVVIDYNQGNDLDYSEETVSVLTVGDYMEELASILHYWALYCKFITSKYFTSSSLNLENGLKLPNLIMNSNFTAKIQSKFQPSFEKMYMYYFNRSLEKAISIEELPPLEPYLSPLVTTFPDQAPCSSVIEDVTLVLNNTLRCTIDTSQPSSVKRFVTEGYKIILNDLIAGYFMKSLRDNQPRYNSLLQLIQPGSLNGGMNNGATNINSSTGLNSPGVTRSSTPAPDAGSGGMGFFKGASSALGSVVGTGVTSVVNSATAVQQNPKLLNFILILNTVAMGQEYFTKIIQNITGHPEYLKNSFPFGNDKNKIEQILLDEFLNPFTTTTNKLIQENLIVLYNQAIKSNLIKLVGDFLPESSPSSYLIYSSSALNDTSTMLKLATSWQALIRPYKQTLHKSLLFNKLLRLLVVNLTNLIEKKLMLVLDRFKINELGALKLEKDLSFLINEVCEDNYDLREKFIRVTQLVMLVGMDDDEYEMSLQSGASHVEQLDEDDDDENDLSGINWVLTSLERKKARNFRV